MADALLSIHCVGDPFVAEGQAETNLVPGRGLDSLVVDQWSQLEGLKEAAEVLEAYDQPDPDQGLKDESAKCVEQLKALTVLTRSDLTKLQRKVVEGEGLSADLLLPAAKEGQVTMTRDEFVSACKRLLAGP